MLNRIESLLRRSDGEDRVMPPTHVFNEGWLLRVTLDWFAEHPDLNHVLAVPRGARWYSEALMSSQFLPRERGDPLSEAYTHADGAIGEFEIGSFGEGDLRLSSDARRFVVIEAKLGSPLSSGTKNAPDYDQAARNVACMAQILSIAPRGPADMHVLGFFVVAPASQIKDKVFAPHLSRDSIRAKVSQRVAGYRDSKKTAWFDEWFLPTLERTAIEAVSWEDLGDFIRRHDPEAGAEFAAFYARCLHYNRLARR